jgi:peptide/nickel transport system substrate-binding protein
MAGRLTVVVDIEMNGLDPNDLVAGAARRVAGNICPGLVRVGMDWSPEAALADEWVASRDGKAVVFRLARGATYHSGRPVTAESVVENFTRVLSAEAGTFQRLDYQVIDSMEVADPRTVRFRLREAFAPFLGLLANGTGMTDVRCLPGRDPRTRPVGAGPYEVIDWLPGDRLELRAFPGHHRKDAAQVAEVSWRFVTDDGARAEAVRRDRHCLAWAPAARSLGDLRARGVHVDVAEGHGPTHLAFDCAAPPFADRRVRQAVAHAVDRRRLLDELFGGLGTVSGTPFAPGSPWHADLPAPAHDPDRARHLLASAGHRGLELTLPVNGPAGLRIARVLEPDLARAGLRIRPVAHDNPAWWPGVYTGGGWRMILQTWTPMPDPDQVLWRRYHSRGAFNTGRYASRAMDELLERGRRTLDLAARRAIYARAQEVLLEDLPTVYLFHEPAITAWGDGVTGYQPRPTWETYVDTVRLESPGAAGRGALERGAAPPGSVRPARGLDEETAP